MTNLEEVKAFARDYINGNQTSERRRTIAAAYFQVTGENLRSSCKTCIVEAIFKILRFMEKQPCQYRLKKGMIIQPFGGGIITNDNLTDAIAEQALTDHTANPSMFSAMPAPKQASQAQQPEKTPVVAHDDLAKAAPVQQAKQNKRPKNKK
jgi:hypothetical protein